MAQTRKQPATRGGHAQRHIVAMGGGGFSMEPSQNPLDEYILALTGKRRPKVCFVPTASGDAATYIEKFEAAFKGPRFKTAVASVFKGDIAGLPNLLLEQDVIYVGGGNTVNLLALWKLHGVDKAILAAWRRGAVLAGISAGMNCWFEACSTDSFGPKQPFIGGLGLVNGAACPHFDGEPDRRPTLLKWIATGKLPTTLAADDYAAFHFVSRVNPRGRMGPTELHACIKSRLGAGCYRIEQAGKSARIEALPTRLLPPV